MLLFEVLTWSTIGLAIGFFAIVLRGGRLVTDMEQLRLLALGLAGGLVGGTFGGLLVGSVAPGRYRLPALLLAGATAALLLFTVGPDRRPRVHRRR